MGGVIENDPSLAAVPCYVYVCVYACSLILRLLFYFRCDNQLQLNTHHSERLLPTRLASTMAGDHKCPVCNATFTRPQHVARHMRSRKHILSFRVPPRSSRLPN